MTLYIALDMNDLSKLRVDMAR